MILYYNLVKRCVIHYQLNHKKNQHRISTSCLIKKHPPNYPWFVVIFGWFWPWSSIWPDFTFSRIEALYFNKKFMVWKTFTPQRSTSNQWWGLTFLTLGSVVEPVEGVFHTQSFQLPNWAVYQLQQKKSKGWDDSLTSNIGYYMGVS